MEFTPSNLEKAVSLFYRTETGQQAEAHQWLTEAQKSTQAWSFVWELLNPHQSPEVQFFAATTLHMKLLKYWNEVPTDHYESLKKRILEAIVNFATGPKIVLNRLCIALSAYIIHTLPVYWPNAFEDLVSSFQPQHLPNVEPERVIWILLEILTVTPEEFQSTALSMSQRNKVRAVLQEVSKDILKVVEMCLMPFADCRFDMNNLITYLNAARCASAWIQLGGVNVDECCSLTNILIDLTYYVYWNRLDSSGMSSEELELTEMTLEALTAIMQHPHTHKYRKHVLEHTFNFLEKFTKILETERNNPDPNKDIVNNIYGLIVTTADTHSKTFIHNMKSEDMNQQAVSRKLFEAILRCTDLPGSYPIDESSSIITFGFWYTLQDDILSMETAECAEYLLKIKPYYRDLVCVLLRKSMFPNVEKSHGWSLDDKEVFRCYRQDIADTFMYCYNVLNIEMLDILNTKLMEALEKSNNNGIVLPMYWNEIETCLHAYSAVSECIELENLYLPKLMVTLKNIPYAEMHPRVLATALETTGAYSEWITEHPDMLENVIPLVLSGLAIASVSPSATMALKDITHNCKKYLQPYGDVILAAAQNALQSGNLKLTECLRLKYSIGKVLSIMPPSTVMDYFNVILTPSFNEIQRLLSMESDTTVDTNIITRLKMLSALFCSLHVSPTSQSSAQQPTLVILQNTMPLYKMISEKYYGNAEIMEVLSGLLKHAFTTLLDDSKPVINDVLQLIVDVYREHPQSSVLGLAKTLIIMFGKDEDLTVSNQQLITQIVNTTLEMCARFNNDNRLSEKSDVFESFFCTIAQVFRKVPHLIVTSGVDTAALFQCAVLCMGMPETQTLKACACFLISFISQSRETAQATVVQAHGESLVMRILINLGGSTPRTSGDVLSELLLILNKKYCDNLARWLQTLLAQDGFPSHRINRQQKDNFIKLVLREKANKRKLFEIVTEFMLICRGIIKTDNSS